MIELKSMPMTSDRGDMDRALFLAQDCLGLPASLTKRYEGREAEVLAPPDTVVPDMAVPGERLCCTPPSLAWVEHSGGPSGGRTRKPYVQSCLPLNTDCVSNRLSVVDARDSLDGKDLKQIVVIDSSMALKV